MVSIYFYLTVFIIIYPYIVYPCLLWIRNKLKVNAINKIDNKNFPSVSIVLAVKNEEKIIRRRLNNLVKLNYPDDKLEIIVVSDGSTDQTNKILDEFTITETEKIGHEIIIKKISYFPSMGKPYALNKGVSHATGEIILFADCRQIFDPSVIRELVANFDDQNVGCVSGELKFRENLQSDIQAEMGAYWKYEKWLRKLESSTGSVVGATGAIYAIRKKLYQPLPVETLLDDVLTPMNIAIQGYRVIFEPRAVAYDTVSKDLKQERKRKLRTLAGNWQLLSLVPELLSPWKNPLWWRFISHKICRLIIPFLLPFLLAFSFMEQSLFYRFVAWLQVGFYSVAFMGFLIPSLRKNRLINLSCFFLAMNLIAAGGFFVWCLGRCKYAWQDNIFFSVRK